MWRLSWGGGLAGLGGLVTAVAASFKFFVYYGKTNGPSQIDVAAVTPAGQAVTVRP